jgi:ribosome maturation factor RimP
VEWQKESKNGADKIACELRPLAAGLGLELIEVSLAGCRGGVRIRIVVFSRNGVCIDDCTRFHRAIMPNLQKRFGDAEITLEVSSPGIERLVRDCVELGHYTGCMVKLYIPEYSDWKQGRLISAAESGIEIETESGVKRFNLNAVAKAKLIG